MGPDGAVNILFRKEIDKAADTEARRKELQDDYRSKFANPYRAAELGYVDEVIDPAITRMRLIRSFEIDVYKRQGQRMYDFGSYRPSGSMANWNLPATLPNDKSERMKDEFSGRTFLEVTFIEGLKFKTSFNFDLINYNSPVSYTHLVCRQVPQAVSRVPMPQSVFAVSDPSMHPVHLSM